MLHPCAAGRVAPRRTCMNRILLVALAALAVVSTTALAHPPAVDNHNTCLRKEGTYLGPASALAVTGVLSYLSGPGGSLPCQPGDVLEFGSEAGACPAWPTVGPIPGAYCGPLVAPGGTATCRWETTNPIERPEAALVIAFDRSSGVVLPVFSGFVNLALEGERPGFGPFGPGEWRVTNPYPASARVIGFPTSQDGLLWPADLNELECFTP